MVEITDILRCPCAARSELDFTRFDEGVVHCRHPGCAYHQASSFPVINGQVAVVDFDNSVLDRDALLRSQGRSVIRRRRRTDPLKRVKSLMLEHNQVAAMNARKLAIMLRAKAAPASVLIVGGGTIGAGTECLYADDALRVIAFDVYASECTDFIGDAHSIPLADASVDAVWIQGVMQSLHTPEAVAREFHRVLRPNGLLYCESGFLQQVYEGAYDFMRYTDSGQRWLFRAFDCIETGAVAGPGTATMCMVKCLASGLLRSQKLGTAASLPFFWLQYLDRFVPDGYARDGAYGCFFLGRKGASGIGPKDITQIYRGAM